MVAFVMFALTSAVTHIPDPTPNEQVIYVAKHDKNSFETADYGFDPYVTISAPHNRGQWMRQW
ncbi:hypothetical protein B9Q01_09030 [Candidatus Marsarchaeota G1 archaeon OSP_D]|uniref:Uncharacterized protein n=3 Tax=Candidatus Marsarchaeota group 1 TaxID=2203770 RepID=A0A2R6A6N1_9ARCH|nr:MAG: hypothetical protein B9Q02_12215 [Candidatus Marsarchaeota G1 archaeon BE_D]PSN82097.1 MAG: hypothetical protein B9Q01_09030 [Candidatus Marsarchaeota G1 archaeon OSP_D]PSN87461.1 MAG: hypothetical protein B9Q00_08770 [Candidatus Marsarchaeota G1 archaeon OSP_C]